MAERIDRESYRSRFINASVQYQKEHRPGTISAPGSRNSLSEVLGEAFQTGDPEILRMLFQTTLINNELLNFPFNDSGQLRRILEQGINLRRRIEFSGDFCPDCGVMLVLEEGAAKCFTCGFSKLFPIPGTEEKGSEDFSPDLQSPA